MIVLKTGKADTKSLQTIPNTTSPTRIPNKIPITENTSLFSPGRKLQKESVVLIAYS